MTYLEAREKLLTLTDDQIHMQETIPRRPLRYSKPSYYVSVFHREEHLSSKLNCSSWKKAVAEVEDKIEEIEVREFSKKLYENGEVAA